MEKWAIQFAARGIFTEPAGLDFGLRLNGKSINLVVRGLFLAGHIKISNLTSGTGGSVLFRILMFAILRWLPIGDTIIIMERRFMQKTFI